ncbi:MAG: TatD family hydrolase [Clostridia bacterium]|nr:TatD family hydrolase [Clostridia bacterium]
MTPVYDAHAHAGSAQEQAHRARVGIRTMLSCGNPAQAREAETICRASSVFSMTAGIHPWYAAETSIEDMRPWMEDAALIGEIGLDSVWCDTPIAAQRRAFAAQLDWAAAHGKGVVLHTKGCESEIARLMEGFPYPVIVHWYSGEQDALDRFLAQGCYLTIGPDVLHNPLVQAVARFAPDDRILFETDGMDAVRWALGGDAAQLPVSALHASLIKAAQLRVQPPEALLNNANGNFLRLLSR